MSIKGIHWAQEVRGVCPYRKALLFALGERHNKDTGICCPDQVMLADDAGMTDRTVRKYIAMLIRDGFISRKVTSPGRGLVTHYILHFDRKRPQDTATNRNDIPVTNRKDVPVSKRKEIPVAKGDQPERQVGPTGTCVPVHKNTNKPEDISSNELVRSGFDELWAIWPAKGRERSKAKALVLEVFRKAASKHPSEAIVASARAWLRGKDPQYTPALDRWLRDGKHTHNLPSQNSLKGAQAPALSAEDKLYAWETFGRWDAEWGPKPEAIEMELL